MPTTWWTPKLIEATLTASFIHGHLLPSEIPQLGEPPRLGTLTSSTYLDWILRRAQKLFLILVDVGRPDQIFGLVDDGWEDGDLPLEMDQIAGLMLTPARDERLERRFWTRQFVYLVSEVVVGECFDYSEHAVVPVESLEKKPLGSERVLIGNDHEAIYWRRRVPLDIHGVNGPTISAFHNLVSNLQPASHEHLISYHASYTHQSTGYILYTPASETTLKAFLAAPTPAYKNLPKPHRKELIINWILCLADTIAYLHTHGKTHGYIRPSTIHISHDMHLFLSDTSAWGPEPHIAHHASFDRESYDYGAPEIFHRPHASSPLLSQNTTDFSISRPDFLNTPPTPTQSSSHSKSTATDIFSLACIILDLLTHLLKKTTKFPAHRAAKHKTAGRGGAVLDASFHRNLGQVESWMSELARDSTKKVGRKDGNHVYRGFVPLLHVVKRMLASDPRERLTAVEAQEEIYRVVTGVCQIAEPHCVNRYEMRSPMDDLVSGMSHMQFPTIDGHSPSADSGRFNFDDHFPQTPDWAPSHKQTPIQSPVAGSFHRISPHYPYHSNSPPMTS